jgi:steroid 5-alpha reductase family enzyme
MREEIKSLENKLTGLHNDARYHDLRRTYGEYSIKVLRHLIGIEGVQARGENHT